MPSVPIDLITIGTDRYRRTMGKDFPRLKANIDRYGLINPICITKEDHLLVAGERRLRACKELGWPDIEVTYFEELDWLERKIIERSENIHRADFSPREDHNGIIEIYEGLKQRDPNVTQVTVGEVCGLTKNSIFQHLLVEKWRKLDALVDKALDQDFTTALGKASNAEKQWKADEEAKALYAARVGNGAAAGNGAGNGAVPTNGAVEDSAAPAPNGEMHSPTHQTVHIHPIDILTADFNEWARTYEGQPFNLIHIDFPYGINSQDHAGQNSSNQDKYPDTPAVRDRLYETFVTHLDRFCAPSAHLIFWFSPKHYCMVREMLCKLPGFEIDEHPLIWQRGKNEGVATFPRNAPRRIFEMAFFGWRNGRTLGTAGPKANLYEDKTDREYHPHEKSQDMLEHFFSMLVGAGTRLLDPTCGSGSAIRAAQSLGVKHILGLEADNEYTARARMNLLPTYRDEGDIDLDALGFGLPSASAPSA